MRNHFYGPEKRMFQPAHKDTMTPAGQIVDKWKEAVVSYESKQKKPQTFQEWWRVYNSVMGCPPAHVAAEDAWNAAKRGE